MPLPDANKVTALLRDLRGGNAEAESLLAAAVYEELRRIARGRMRSERSDHTLQPTILVHEAWLQLVAQKDRDWQSRTHFYAIASHLMRRILIDHARKVRAKKRSGEGGRPEPLDFDIAAPSVKLDELLLIDLALTELELLDPRQARVVELRFFGGLTEAEISEILEITPRTVRRDWQMARSFLRQRVAGSATG